MGCKKLVCLACTLGWIGKEIAFRCFSTGTSEIVRPEIVYLVDVGALCVTMRYMIIHVDSS